jgi:Cu/Ag efflux protein CusF
MSAYSTSPARANALAIATIVLVAACQSAPPAPVSLSDTETVTATVEKIDPAKRLLTLRSPSGDLVTVQVDPAVVNFPQIKVGDKVSATYTESVLVQLVSSGQQTGDPTVSVDGDVAPVGARPGGSISAQTNVPVTIASVDAKNNIVQFYTNDGVLRAITVQNPQAQAFIKKLKPGDNVTVTFTEAFAVSVTPVN